MKPVWHEHIQVGEYKLNDITLLGKLITCSVRVYADTIILYDRKTGILAARCHASLSDDWAFDWLPADQHHCETHYVQKATEAQLTRHCIALADNLASRVAASIPPDDLRTEAELRGAALETTATQES